MKYRCLVVDDNEIERDAIEMHLKKIQDLEIIAVCSDGIEAASVLAKQSIDIVFSDIDMPELSGTSLLRSLKNQPVFIFISSYSEYAAESYELDALDFIVKPASFERILKAANKAIEYLELKAVLALHAAKTDTDVNIQDDFFFFKASKGITRMKYKDVIYMESMGDFSKLYTQHEKHVVLVGLKNLEKQLPASKFKRIHKQHIINTSHILTIAQHEVYLSGDFVVPISSSSRQELMDQITGQKTLIRFKK